MDVTFWVIITRVRWFCQVKKWRSKKSPISFFWESPSPSPGWLSPHPSPGDNVYHRHRVILQITRTLIYMNICIYIHKINNLSLKVFEFIFRIWTKIINESELINKGQWGNHFFLWPYKRWLQIYEKLAWMHNSKLLRQKKI